VPCLHKSSGLGRFEWTMWWFALCGIAVQDFVDISLWSWFVLVGLFVGRALHLTRGNRLTSVLAGLAVIACAISVPVKPFQDYSMVRSLLPSFQLSLITHPNWSFLSSMILVFMLIGCYFSFVRKNEARQPWITYVLAVTPVVLAHFFRHQPAVGVWVW